MPKLKSSTVEEAVVNDEEVAEQPADNGLAEMYTKLSAPFDKTFKRQIPGGPMLEYITTEQVVSRLNETPGFGRWEWSSKKPTIVEDEVLVSGTLTIFTNPESYNSVSMTGFGGSRIKRKRADGTPLSIGNDTKAADSDAFKKAAAKFGIGLYLSVRTGEGESELPTYSNNTNFTVPTPNGEGPKFPTNTSASGTRTVGRITAKSNNGINVNGEWYNIGAKFPPPDEALKLFAQLTKGDEVAIIHGVGKNYINGLERPGAPGLATSGVPTQAAEEEEEEVLAF